MKHSKSFRVITAGATLAMVGMGLAGCEAKPGIAAYGDDVVVTEQELGQVTAEMGQYLMVDRASILQLLLVLNSGGREALDGCPTWEDIPVKDLNIPADAKLSQDSKDALTLSLCQALADPAQAENLGLPVTSPSTVEAIAAAGEKAQNDASIRYSNREQAALNYLRQ